MVYSNKENAELFLNGKSQGKKKVDNLTFSVSWDVPYEAGELKLVAFSDGEEPLTDTVVTVGEAASLALRLENPGVRKNNRDTAIITAYLQDSEGRELPESPELLVKFRVIQGGKILCVGSPNKWDHDSWQIPQVKMFENKAQVYVECSADTDVLELEAVCEGYAPAVISITKIPADVIADVTGEDCRFLQKWHISPPRVEMPMPDINVMNESPDFEGWKYFEVGRGSADIFAGCPQPRRVEEGEAPPEPFRVIYHSKSIVPYSHDENKKLTLHFEKFEGSGKVIFYSQGKRFEDVKENFSYGQYTADASELTPGADVDVWVVIESRHHINCICRPVRWRFE